MKIAVIGAKGLPAGQGGIEHYCEELYPRIVAEGNSVDLFARSSYIKKRWFSISFYKGVRVICLPSLAVRGLDAFSNSAIAAIVASIINYDVVHFHALGPALFSFLPRYFSSAKIVVTCQGLDWQRGKWGNLSSSVIRLGEKIAVKYAHGIIVVSKALQNYFVKTYNRNSFYIPNAPGVYPNSDPCLDSIKSFGLSQGKYLLFLGRLVPEKRPDLLIEAFQKLKLKGWKLVLAGGNSDTSKYISKLVELSNGNSKIVFAGELRGNRLAEIVRGAGLFVLPSDLEGLPLAMLEAMREGIPVVASDIPPHKQLVGSDRGILFNSGDINCCAKALEKAIDQPSQLATMASKAQKHIQTNYNWGRVTSDNLGIYNQNFELVSQEKITESKKEIGLQTLEK